MVSASNVARDLANVAVFDAAALQTASQPLRALLGRAVGPGLGVHAARRLALDAIVADRRGRRQALLDVACLEQATVAGRASPYACEAIGLELVRDRQLVRLARP